MPPPHLRFDRRNHRQLACSSMPARTHASRVGCEHICLARMMQILMVAASSQSGSTRFLPSCVEVWENGTPDQRKQVVCLKSEKNYRVACTSQNHGRKQEKINHSRHAIPTRCVNTQRSNMLLMCMTRGDGRWWRARAARNQSPLHAC